MAIPKVLLEQCEYDKKRKVLGLASNICGMPRALFVHSARTGRDVRFIVVGPEDILFDQDQWDGEQQIYRPVGDVPTVDYLVIYNC